MKKVLLIAVAAALIVGAAFTGSASARDRGDRSDRAALTANQIVAEMDARTARIKADLRLTPEQEKNWAGFESAVRDISKSRADRLVAFAPTARSGRNPTMSSRICKATQSISVSAPPM